MNLPYPQFRVREFFCRDLYAAHCHSRFTVIFRVKLFRLLQLGYIVIACPNCKRENEDTYRYCLGCGGVLPQAEAPAPEPTDSTACKSCGIDVPPNFKFCGSCGTPVAAEISVGLASSTAPSIVEAPSPTVNPSDSAAGYLIVIKPDGSEGAKIPIAGEVVLGRSSTYDVLKNDPFLSPNHASITPIGNEFLVKDLDSLNGVFLRIKGEVELHHNDQIRVGQELLEFQNLEKANPITPNAIDDTQGHGSDASKVWGRLSLISGPEVESHGYVLDSDDVIIGREVGKILFREDGFVSGKHAKVSKVEGAFFLKDLGSSNGTYLRMKTEQRITKGDLVLMGQQLFRLDV